MHYLLIYDVAPDYVERRSQYRAEHLALRTPALSPMADLRFGMRRTVQSCPQPRNPSQSAPKLRIPMGSRARRCSTRSMAADSPLRQ